MILSLSHNDTERRHETIAVLGHYYAPSDNETVEGYTGPGTAWANEMNFVMNHVPDTKSIAGPVDQQSSTLPLSYRCRKESRP